MKQLNPYIMTVVLAGILLTIVACSRGESPVGKWSNTTTPEIVEFRGDKSGMFQVAGMPSLPFTWKMIDNEKIQVDIPFQGKVKPLYGKVAAETLTLEGDGQQAVYRRHGK